jgi:hypothetical protein
MSGVVSFEISQNSQEYTDTGLSYYHEIVIFHFEPPGGPATDGTYANVRGSGFLNLLTLRCKFGDVTVIATWIFPEEIAMRERHI